MGNCHCIYDSKKYYFCNKCEKKFLSEKKHCCKCKITYNNDYSHCCVCNLIYHKNEDKHCKKCHKSHDNLNLERHFGFEKLILFIKFLF